VVADYEWLMNVALEEADKAFKLGEVPVGAVIIDKDRKILSRAHNLKEAMNDPAGHAEIIALRSAAQEIGNWRLSNCTMFVTLEPCPMCLSALIQARIGRVVFGAYDTKGGAMSLGYNFYNDKRLNHNFSVFGGLNHYKCSSMLSNFFKLRRKK
jgi:tRNA(adenine34) deaminase